MKDVIFHLAGMVKHTYHQDDTIYTVNVNMTLDLIDVADQYGARVIFASSSGVQHCHTSIKDEPSESATYSPIATKWPYYDSKIRAEKHGIQKAQQLGVSFISMRSSMMLGPGDVKKRSTQQVHKFLLGKQTICTSGGIDFVDVRDVAKVFVAAIDVEEKYATYNLTGTKMTIKQFFKILESLTTIPAPKTFIPAFLISPAKMVDEFVAQFTGKELLPDKVVVEMVQHYWQSNSAKATTELGFEVRPYKETLQATIDYLEAN